MIGVRRPARPFQRAFPPALPTALLLALLCACQARAAGDERPGLRGAVVSEHPLATAVGLEILEQGGNAADAAVATALALAVVFPEAGNLGGGGFALWAPSRGEPLALDFRETAPAGADPRLYLDEAGEWVPARSLEGPLSVGVPGSPHGLWRLHEEAGSGRFTFRALAAPAIRLAREGFEVDPWLARALRREELVRRMNAAARELFHPGGRPLAEGELLRQPALGRTLERLAERGPDGFYRGEVASAIVRTLSRAPVPGAEDLAAGRMTLDDLRRYETLARAPLRGWFRGHELLVMPPPSSGGLVVLQVLGVLEGLPLDAETAPAPEGEGRVPTARMLHWWAEAMRRAFADRAEHMGDPQYHPVPVGTLLSPEWIAQRRVSIGERAELDVAPWAAAPPREGRQTTHLSVLDADGNALSLTTTLNASFGSGLLVEGAGFLLNNELDDFAVVAGAPNLFGLVGGRANALEPGKRPLSSMSPTIVRDAQGRVTLVLGSPGGPRIITAVLQVALRVLLLEEPLERAVAAPRLHQQWRPAATLLEPGFPPDVAAALRARGHEVSVVEGGRFGSVQAISVGPRGQVEAASDPRRGGTAGIAGHGLTPGARPP